MNCSTLSGTNPLIDFPARSRSLISVDDTSTRRADTAVTPSAFRRIRDPSGARSRITASVASSRIRSGLPPLSNPASVSCPSRRKSSPRHARLATAPMCQP